MKSFNIKNRKVQKYWCQGLPFSACVQGVNNALQGQLPKDVTAGNKVVVLLHLPFIIV